MDKMLIDNKEYLIVDGISSLCTPINAALVDLQNKRQSSGRAVAYYAKNFYSYLIEQSIFDLADVTAADVRYYAEKLVSENKSSSVILACAQVLDEIFDSFFELNGRPHVTLLQGDTEYAIHGRGKAKRRHHTLAGKILRRRLNGKEKNSTPLMLSYTKWYTAEEIACVYRALSLRDRCIFLCSVETGYRISSVLSIKVNINQLQKGLVEETFSKTGRRHPAHITKVLQEDIAEYISNDRRRIVEKADNDCGYLFLQSKGKNVGQPLTYDAYYHALKEAEAQIHRDNDAMQSLILHTHAGRSTYFNRLMHDNEEKKRAGKKYLSDREICHSMDWKTMDCLYAYYDFKGLAIPPSILYADLLFD